MNELGSYQDHTFDGIKLENRSVSGTEYYDCVFRGCSFENVDFTGSCFENCTFVSCSLVAPKLKDVRFLDVAFKESKIVGAIFSALSDFATSFSIEDSVLLSCSFTDMQIPKTSIENCQVEDCQFENSDLRKSSFSRSQFHSGQFRSCDLRECNFLEASGFIINPNENKMRNARFSVENAIDLLNCYGLKYQ